MIILRASDHLSPQRLRQAPRPVLTRVQSGKMGPAPGRFEPPKGILEVKVSSGSGIRDPRF